MNKYEVKVVYDRQTGEDNPGKVKEAYLVPAMNCSEAEQLVIAHIKPYIFGECDTPQIKKRLFFEIFFNDGGEFWYEAKVEMITVDGEKETRKAVNILVQGNSISDALEALKLNLKSYDCNIIGIKLSTIIEIVNITPTESAE